MLIGVHVSFDFMLKYSFQLNKSHIFASLISFSVLSIKQIQISTLLVSLWLDVSFCNVSQVPQRCANCVETYETF